MSSEGARNGQNWKSRVLNEYERLRSQRKARQIDGIAKLWQDNARKKKLIRSTFEPRPVLSGLNCAEKENRCAYDQEKVAGNNGAKDRRKNYATVKSLRDSKNDGQKCVIQAIDKVDQLPSMNYWVSIKRNLRAYEEDQTNIPYFSDDVIEKETAFINNLEEEFNVKSDQEKSDFDDELFLELVNTIKRYLPNEEPSLGTDGEPAAASDGRPPTFQLLWGPEKSEEVGYFEETLDQPGLPSLAVFQAISLAVPGFGSSCELVKRFRSLTQDRRLHDFTANLDGPDAVSVTAERSCHTYKSMFCRRCLTFDCTLHSDRLVNMPLPFTVEKERWPAEQTPNSPCGDDCYMHAPGAVAASKTPEKNSKKHRKVFGGGREKLNLSELGCPPSNFWIPSEETLCRTLAESYASNYCAISQFMLTKTCRQVYEFLLNENIAQNVVAAKTKGRKKKKTTKKGAKRNQSNLYKVHSSHGVRENSHKYKPCYHPGISCGDSLDCSCKNTKNFCEKYCYCAPDCKHRFPGCRCKGKCNTKGCDCFLASRECDPDLCDSCMNDGRTTVYNFEKNSCRNVALQMGWSKKLYIAPSEIAGWGCFLGEPAKKNELVAEYFGEMISQEVCEIRGKVYDKSKCSYMFNLTKEFALDAARFGGKIRFANHSKKPNCNPKNLLVNGDHRIGIFANKDIEVGEELFFNYGTEFHGHDIS